MWVAGCRHCVNKESESVQGIHYGGGCHEVWSEDHWYLPWWQPKNPVVCTSDEKTCQAKGGGLLGVFGLGCSGATDGYKEARRAVAVSGKPFGGSGRQNRAWSRLCSVGEENG